MSTNIIIDDELMEQALLKSGCKTTKEAVEEGLRLLIARSNQAQIRSLRGKLHWEGDLYEIRTEQSKDRY